MFNALESAFDSGEVTNYRVDRIQFQVVICVDARLNDGAVGIAFRHPHHPAWTDNLILFGIGRHPRAGASCHNRQ